MHPFFSPLSLLSFPLVFILLCFLLLSFISTSPHLPLFRHRLDDLASQEASLRLREQLLQQEKQLVKNQNEWLCRELQARSEELFQLRKERATFVGDLEGRLASREQEVCGCVGVGKGGEGGGEVTLEQVWVSTIL